MTNRPRDKRSATRSLGAPLLALMLAAPLGGCGGEKQEEQAAAPAPRPAPIEPADPLAGVELDERVEFPPQRAPESPELAEAIADLANALAAGDADRFAQRLTEPAEAVLRDLEQRGDWGSATASIETVRVVAVDARESFANLGLAVQEPEGAYVLAWQGEPGMQGWRFSGMAIAPRSAALASELDGVDLIELPVPAPGADDELTVDELRAKRKAEEADDQRDRRRRRRR